MLTRLPFSTSCRSAYRRVCNSPSTAHGGLLSLAQLPRCYHGNQAIYDSDKSDESDKSAEPATATATLKAAVNYTKHEIMFGVDGKNPGDKYKKKTKYGKPKLSHFSTKPTLKKTFVPVPERTPIIRKRRNINLELEVKAKEMNLDWRIIGATILHSYPTITHESPKWEVDFHNVQDKINDKRREHFQNLIGDDEDLKILSEENPTYEEIIDTLPFTPASRITEADEKNDRRSHERRLVDSLFLLVKRNREDKAWQFPQGKVLEDENLRQTTERVIDRSVGNINRYFISNAPLGHFCYEYPKEVQEKRKQFGAKVFYYRCQFLQGSIKLETRLYKDYAWVARDELSQYLDEETAEYVRYIIPS